MRVTIKLFAAARESIGADEVLIELADGSSVADLRRALSMAHPGLAPLVERSMFAVNASYAKDLDLIPSGAEVACIPPVSGG
jgi:sulfur-carrier protein